MFVVSQMVNITYYFENCLPNNNNNTIPICKKEFFLELILYAKIIVLYAIYGLNIAIHYIKKNLVHRSVFATLHNPKKQII